MNNRFLDSPKSVMLVLYAALIVESELWPLDAVSKGDFKYLCEMKSVKRAGSDETWEIEQNEKDLWLLDYRARLDRYSSSVVMRDVLSKRMDRTMFSFRLWGYNKDYAGYENQFRVRICSMVGSGKFNEVSDTTWLSDPVQREAANYMAYTDYYEAELKRCGM